MDESTQGVSGRPPRRRGRGFLWAFLAVLIAFGAGFGWQWYEGQSIREQLDRTEKELHIERLRVGLAQAAVAAQAGHFEAARRQMSQFFTRLQAEATDLPPDLSALASSILAQRDDVITGLSRNNAQYVGVLYGLLDRFEAAAPSAEPEAPATPARATPTPTESAATAPGAESVPQPSVEPVPETAGSALPAMPPANDSGPR